MFCVAPTESAFLAPAMLDAEASPPFPADVTNSCRAVQMDASILRSTTVRPSQASPATPRLELITSALRGRSSPQAVGVANQSIARFQPSALALPKLLTALAKRMSWTKGAMPTRFGSSAAIAENDAGDVRAVATEVVPKILVFLTGVEKVGEVGAADAASVRRNVGVIDTQSGVHHTDGDGGPADA